MTKQKLHVVLAKTEYLGTIFKAQIQDYIKFFQKSQGAFKGLIKTYAPKPETIDNPNERANNMIVTTVNEKLDYLKETTSEYINLLFSQEKTNASGTAKAKLVVDGNDFGELSTLELLRLKSLLENSNFKEMYENIPVRSDSERWFKSKNENYLGREGVYESELSTGVIKTTVKSTYILEDPNIKHLDSKAYSPKTAEKTDIMELGDYTIQKFSGEYTHVERAHILQRRSKLLAAVIEALKVANDVELIQSDMTSDKLFNYLHTGNI